MPELTDAISYIDSGGSLAKWRDEICREFPFVDIAGQNDGADFSANLSKRSFASANLLRVDVPSQLQMRTSSGIARDNFCNVSLVYVVSGEVSYHQYGRNSVMRPNDCFAMDFGSPFELSTAGRSQNLTVNIPRTWVTRYLRPEEIAAQRIDGASSWGGVLSAYLRALYINFESTPPISPLVMVDQALQLLELALGGRLPGGSTHQKGLLGRTRSIMREVCHEEDLRPATVAAIVGLSKGYMHRLFARAGTTFCRELDVLRIDRAAALLETQSQRHLTINEIGVKCGLPNAPHFVRKFRSLKGMTPSQYRQSKVTGLALKPAAGRGCRPALNSP